MKYTEEEVEALLDKMKAISDEYDRELDTYNRGQFKSKYGERLGQYSDKLKALNGDDFDVVDSAYDEHNSDYSDLSDDEYVDALENNIKSVIARIWPEATPEEVEQAAEEIKDVAIDGDTTTEEELATSDEKQKKDPNEEIEDKVEDVAKAVSKANPAAEIVVEAATAKPSDVENPDKKEEGTKLDEAYTFSKKDPLYRMSH